MALYAMLAVGVLLLGGVVIIVVFAVMPSEASALQHRLQLVARPENLNAVTTVAVGQRDVRSSKIDILARHVFAAGAKRNWGMTAGALKLLIVAAFFGSVVGLFMSRVVSLPWWLAVVGAVGAAYFVPRMLLLRQQSQVETKFMDLFPDAVDTIVRMLRAGLPMSSAVRLVGDDGSPPVSTVFRMLADQIKIGIPLEEALDASSQRIGLPDYRFFAVTVLLQYSTGGNIASTLDVLATIIRKRRAARGKAKSATAEIRLTAYVLAATPFATMGMLLLMQPNYLAPMFKDPRGHVMLAIAAGLLIATFVTMRAMLRSVTKM